MTRSKQPAGKTRTPSMPPGNAGKTGPVGGKPPARQRTSRASAVRGLPEVAAVLVDGRRKDIEALRQAGRHSYEGVRRLVRRQVDQLKETLGEWQAVIKVMTIAGPRESVAQLDELGKAALQQSLANIRELADLALANQSEAIAIVRQRLDEDIEEIDRLLRHSAPHGSRR